jgi:hypothetical protein
VYGAKIQANILLPVGTIINIEITLKNLQQKITSLGKVKWNKFIIDNESYEVVWSLSIHPTKRSRNYMSAYRKMTFLSQ